MCMIKDKGRIWCVLMSSYCVRFAATGLPGKSPPDFTCPCPLRGMGGEQCGTERGGWILGETANVRPSEAQRQFIIRVSTASPNFANLFFNKILVGPFQSFFQGYFRGPVEVFHCLFVGKGGAVDVPFSGRAVGWGNFFSGNTGKDGDQFVQADFCLGAEVVAGIGIWCGQCQADAPGNVAGVDEVSGLLTVSEDGNVLSFSEAFGKDADDTAFPPSP